jgi:hypothetical protein
MGFHRDLFLDYCRATSFSVIIRLDAERAEVRYVVGD